MAMQSAFLVWRKKEKSVEGLARKAAETQKKKKSAGAPRLSFFCSLSGRHVLERSLQALQFEVSESFHTTFVIIINTTMSGSYDSWNVNDLKGELRKRNLSVAGRKSELVERLNSSIDQDSSVNEAPARPASPRRRYDIRTAELRIFFPFDLYPSHNWAVEFSSPNKL
jgi:hypothetical protein